MKLERLKEPFLPEDIEWRISQSGISNDGKPWAKVLAYITARAGQERLDEVFGPLGWSVEYRQQEYIAGKDRETAFICKISVRQDDGSWVSKEDGAATTDFEAFKGGISGAFKRCCASGFGIGRYLYGLSECFAETSIERQKGWNYAKTKDNKVFYWNVPTDALPEWALPAVPHKDTKPPIKAPAPTQITPPPAKVPETKPLTALNGIVARVGSGNYKGKEFWIVELESGEKANTLDRVVGQDIIRYVGCEIEIPYTVTAKGSREFTSFKYVSGQVMPF